MKAVGYFYFRWEWSCSLLDFFWFSVFMFFYIFKAFFYLFNLLIFFVSKVRHFENLGKRSQFEEKKKKITFYFESSNKRINIYSKNGGKGPILLFHKLKATYWYLDKDKNVLRRISYFDRGCCPSVWSRHHFRSLRDVDFEALKALMLKFKLTMSSICSHFSYSEISFELV